MQKGLKIGHRVSKIYEQAQNPDYVLQNNSLNDTKITLDISQKKKYFGGEPARYCGFHIRHLPIQYLVLLYT